MVFCLFPFPFSSISGLPTSVYFKFNIQYSSFKNLKLTRPYFSLFPFLPSPDFRLLSHFSLPLLSRSLVFSSTVALAKVDAFLLWAVFLSTWLEIIFLYSAPQKQQKLQEQLELTRIGFLLLTSAFTFILSITLSLFHPP